MTRAERLRAWLERLATVGVRPDDSEATRFVKAVFTVVAVLTGTVATIWVILYLALGLPVSAAVPLSYQVITVFSLILVARTKRLRSSAAASSQCSWCFRFS